MAHEDIMTQDEADALNNQRACIDIEGNAVIADNTADTYGWTTTANNQVVTLPTLAVAANLCRILRIVHVAGDHTGSKIDGEGAETINGAADYVLPLNKFVTLYPHTTGWYISAAYPVGNGDLVDD